MADQPGIALSNQVGPAPVSGSDVAGVPRKERMSFKKLGQFFWSQYMSGLSIRRHHANAWVMIQSFLKGIHYFSLNNAGQWFPIPPQEGEVRQVTPVIMSNLRHILGFLNSNELSVSSIPISGSSNSLYNSERAEDILSGWIEDANVGAFQDRMHQIFVTEGMVGFLRYIDTFRKNVFLKALPASELFPVPFDAKTDEETSGTMHVALVTRQWLELQDRLYELKMGQPPAKPLADKAKVHNLGMRTDLPLVGAGGKGGKLDGALAITAYMKASEEAPQGSYTFMLGQDVYRYAGPMNGTDPSLMIPDGKIPIELAHFFKNPSDWWGTGPAEMLIPSQLSLNRQMTQLERSAKSNRSLTFVDTNAIQMSDVQNQNAPLIPMDREKLASNVKPVEHYPAQPVSRDVVASIEMNLRLADQAAGFRSGIAFGQQEGRTEGGPATTLLAQNAMASLKTPMVNLDRAWNLTYSGVLDMLHTAWPEEKVIRIGGPRNIGRELKVIRSQMPWSRDVLLRSRIMNPGGVNARASILFQLRQIPGEDGTTGTEVSSQEFRQALMEMNLLPPGLSLADRPSARIQNRINLLIGDGKIPAIQPSDPANPSDRLSMENHKLAIEMLKNAILDDGSWNSYGNLVKRSLLQQLEFHRTKTFGGVAPPDQFDDDLERFEMQQLGETMSNMEADLETEEGDFITEPSAEDYVSALAG